MAKQSNTLRNSSRDDDAPSIIEEVARPDSTEKTEKPKAKKREPKAVEEPVEKAPSRLKTYFNTAKDFVLAEKTSLVFGWFCLLFGVYLAFAFTSFLFTWQHDQDKMLGSWWKLIGQQDLQVENWLGKFGAILSYKFINQAFGVASFLFIPILLNLGLKLVFKIKMFPVGKTFRYLFYTTVWCSTALAMVFNQDYFFLGGNFGYVSSIWLNGLLGYGGTWMLLSFSLLTFLIVAYNVTFDWFSKSATVDEEAIINAPIAENIDNIADDKKNAYAKIDPLPPVFEIEVDEPFLKNAEEENGNVVEFEVANMPVPPVDPIVHELEMDIAEPIHEDVKLEIETPKEQETFNDFNIVQNQIEAERLANAEKSKEEDEFNLEKLGQYDPTLDLSGFQFPTIDLLNSYGGDKSIDINVEELEANKNRIVETLKNYNIGIAKIKASVGPTVTLYEIIPDAGIRISKIKNLEDDIALSLSALGIRIIAPMPGKGTIGIEVPNSRPDMVPMRYIIASEKFQNSDMELPIAFGKTILNETFVIDLAKMPHLLMAGATGQGKSVGLNAVLTSLLYKKHPAFLKFVLVDPKKVELTLFNKIERHYLAKLPDTEEAIITDTKKVVHTLNSLCIEMDNRYELLKDAQVRNLKEYNAKFIDRKLKPTEGHRFLPYIVLVVDEFADLIMTAGKEVEAPIARLAQLARAIGIHLIIATQRPSVNIITGTIKANFPARIAFRVTSKIDSRTILDSGGAEQLIGRGDMLLSTGNDLIRLQCAFVDTPEVDRICDFIGNQRAYTEAYQLPEYVDESGDGIQKEDVDLSQKDKFFGDAARLIVQHQQGSTSLIQRKLKLGYNRAGRIIDQLEAAGIVGPFEGSKARQVLVKDENSLNDLLSTI